MYYVKAKNEHKNFKNVSFTEGKLYPILQMQPSSMNDEPNSSEFMLTDDKGTTRWSHHSWFEREIIWKEEGVQKQTVTQIQS